MLILCVVQEFELVVVFLFLMVVLEVDRWCRICCIRLDCMLWQSSIFLVCLVSFWFLLQVMMWCRVMVVGGIRMMFLVLVIEKVKCWNSVYLCMWLLVFRVSIWWLWELVSIFRLVLVFLGLDSILVLLVLMLCLSFILIVELGVKFRQMVLKGRLVVLCIWKLQVVSIMVVVISSSYCEKCLIWI